MLQNKREQKTKQINASCDDENQPVAIKKGKKCTSENILEDTEASLDINASYDISENFLDKKTPSI
ncbi:9723_t:CDS:2 [Funneliformis geosporum]|nr:9723_t:CDS:2 [Funneliformis geosporum]